MSVLRFALRRDTSIAATLVLGWVYWLICHPYMGIYHDARIYNLLALNWLHPEAYTRDLFFLFGSQDKFSFFSPIFAALIQLLGLDGANRALALIGGAAWIAGVACLSRQLLGPGTLGRYVVLFCAVIDYSYSPNLNTFSFNESFATSRMIAMPLVLGALALDLRGSARWAWVLHGLAVAFHPLMGIWGPLISLARRIPERALAWLVPGVVVAIFLGGWLSVHPLLALMNPNWVDAVRHTSSDVFFSEGDKFRWTAMLFWIGALCLGSVLGKPVVRPLYRIVALLTLWALLLSLLCSYFLPIALVMQVQSWRALWVAIVLGIVALADVVRQSWPKVELRYWLVLLLAIGLTWEDYVPALLWVAVMLGYGMALSRGLKRLMAMPLRMGRIAWCLPLGMGLIVLPSYCLLLEISGTSLRLPEWNIPIFLKGFIAGGGGGFFLLILAWLLGRQALRVPLLVISLVSLIVAYGEWDKRTATVRRMESSYGMPTDGLDDFRRVIHPGEVVAWPNRTLHIWYSLGTASYASPEQAIGIVFSQRKTELSRERLHRLSAAATMETPTITLANALARYENMYLTEHKNLNNLSGYGRSNLSDIGASYVCQDPAVDWVVARGVPPIAGRLIPSTRYDKEVKPLYLMRCTDLR